MQCPSVFSYVDYRDYLKDWVEFQKSNRSGFSIRGLSIKIGISNSYLHMVFARTRRLSKEVLDRIVPLLKINESETAYLNLLRDLADAESPEDRHAALKRLQKFRSFNQLESENLDVHQYLTHWYYVAIRELAETKGFKADPAWICERLSGTVSEAEVKEALEFLQTRGFIDICADGTALRKDRELRCHEGIYRLSLGDFHRQVLNLASDSIDNVPRHLRNLTGYMAAVQKEDLGKIQKVLAEAEKKIAKITGAPKASNKSEVYYFGLYSFPVTRKEKVKA